LLPITKPKGELRSFERNKNPKRKGIKTTAQVFFAGQAHTSKQFGSSAFV
jgi:hypothetical protein